VKRRGIIFGTDPEHGQGRAQQTRSKKDQEADNIADDKTGNANWARSATWNGAAVDLRLYSFPLCQSL